MAASNSASLITRPSPVASLPLTPHSVYGCQSRKTVSPLCSTSFLGGSLLQHKPKNRGFSNLSGKVRAAVTTEVEEAKTCILPTWADFDLGKAPVYWKTMNGLPPTSGEKLTLFYNPAARNLTPHENFGIAFNGGFNQPIMCGGEPMKMTQKIRGKADPPIYTIKICIPRHAVNLMFSFTNGVVWDGPYKLQFEVLKQWSNKPLSFFNEGLTKELSKDGACEKAIFPDSVIVVNRCAMIGNLTTEGGDRCNLDFVLGCTDPSSPFFNPLANVDDGCPLETEPYGE